MRTQRPQPKMDSLPIPVELRTGRLYLRSWRKSDAARLLPVLEDNVDHLGGWIPAHVAAPAPLEELERRLAGFAGDFQASRYWRFGMFSADGNELLGEVDLFPRSAEGRVDFPSADRLEIGYWLRRDATGKGYASEASRALLDVAVALPGIRRVEIHCDPRNAPSAAVPRRLGFRPEPPDAERSPAEGAMMLWVRDVEANGVSESVV
jgi:RimJ/RimL family protein N-acetyltransferase